jgi:hypothetical protein
MFVVGVGATTGDESPPIASKLRRMMSRTAVLAAVATRRALAAAAWPTGDGVGFYLGAGGSTGDMDELLPALRAACASGQFSLADLGRAGLAAANPLLTFQLLENFSLCHAAIAEGTTGPNAVFFSRGAGTVVALAEALHAIGEGDCARALAGGADSALHPLVRAETPVDDPGEGAAILAISSEPGARPLARVAACELAPREIAGVDATLRPRSATLAAAPALGWVRALDLIAQGARRVAVVAGGLVVLEAA